MDPALRLKRHVVVEGECWLWTGQVDRDGYGRLRYRGHETGAHRYAFLLANPGVDPETVDHLCHTNACTERPCPHRRCVRPDHLAASSRVANILRRTVERGDRCRFGHELDGVNTTSTPGSPKRFCRTCKRNLERARRADRRRASQAVT